MFLSCPMARKANGWVKKWWMLYLKGWLAWLQEKHLFEFLFVSENDWQIHLHYYRQKSPQDSRFDWLACKQNAKPEQGRRSTEIRIFWMGRQMTRNSICWSNNLEGYMVYGIHKSYIISLISSRWTPPLPLTTLEIKLVLEYFPIFTIIEAHLKRGKNTTGTIWQAIW